MVSRWLLHCSCQRRFRDFIPVHQYHPGNGKGDPVIAPDSLPSGTDLYPVDLYLNHMFGLEGVIYAQPAADYLSIVVAILICTHLFRTMEHRNESVEA